MHSSKKYPITSKIKKKTKSPKRLIKKNNVPK